MDYQEFSYLRGAAVILDAGPCSLRNGHGAKLNGGNNSGKSAAFNTELPRPRRRLIGRGPVDIVGQVMLQQKLSTTLLHESMLEGDYSLSHLTNHGESNEKRSILILGSLRVDLSAFESILRVRAGCYLLPQAGARAIVVVLEIPPKRPSTLEADVGDEQYIFVESGDDKMHPSIVAFEECLKKIVNLVDINGVATDNGSVDGTSLREVDQKHLVQFANTIFAECDELLVNSTKQGVGPMVASTIKLTGNLLCRTLITTSAVAGCGVKAFGKALQEVIAPKTEDMTISEDTVNYVETAEWIGEKTIGASEIVVSATSKAVKYTGRVITEKVLQSHVNNYWTGGVDSLSAQQNGFFHAMGTIMEALVTSAVELHLSVQKSTWSLLSDLKDTAIDLVDHRYGNDAALATGKSMSAAMNVGSATMHAASLAKNSVGIAKDVAKESGNQIVSMEQWMNGSLQMYGSFESEGTTGWSQVWGILRPDALAMYTLTDLVQERPKWVVATVDIAKISRENLGNDHASDAQNGVNSKQCRVKLVTRSHVIWTFRFGSQEEGMIWSDALIRCVRSCSRCKLLGCTVDEDKLDFE